MAGHDRKTQGELVKAQITIFIIIGALVVVAFGVTLYVGGKMGERIEGKETTQRMEQLGIQPIQDYINTCLSLATTEGLALIGRQGGTIYKSQGGLTKNYDEAPGENYVKYPDSDLGTLDVSFLIMPPTNNVGNAGCATDNTCLFYSQPSNYPFIGFPYPPEETTPLFSGYYGISRLPPLYKKTPEGEQVTNSIQENLELYIAKRTAECASWTTFEEKGYSVSAGDATAEIIFASQAEQLIGEQYITTELKWPIEITTPAGDKTVITDFALKEQVRLATIYFTIKRIIDADVTDISYKPQNEGAFEVSIYPHGENSFVIVKDTQSIVKTKPFEFWIPRKNRKPALWQINTEPLKDATFHVTPEGRGARITTTDNTLRIEDPCQESGTPNPFLLELQASDPDEDPVTFDVYICSSCENEIPQDAPSFGEFGITVFAHDRSAKPSNMFDEGQFDSQQIPLQTAICEVR